MLIEIEDHARFVEADQGDGSEVIQLLVTPQRFPQLLACLVMFFLLLLLEFFYLGLKPLYLAFLIFFSPHSSERSVSPMGRGFQRIQPCCQWRGAFSP